MLAAGQAPKTASKTFELLLSQLEELSQQIGAIEEGIQSESPFFRISNLISDCRREMSLLQENRAKSLVVRDLMTEF